MLGRHEEGRRLREEGRRLREAAGDQGHVTRVGVARMPPAEERCVIS